jgi:hypothetical protein
MARSPGRNFFVESRFPDSCTLKMIETELDFRSLLHLLLCRLWIGRQVSEALQAALRQEGARYATPLTRHCYLAGSYPARLLLLGLSLGRFHHD